MALTSARSRGALADFPPSFWTTSSTVSTIDVKPIFPEINEATHTSFAALKIAGSPPPSAPQRRAKSIAGKRSLSIGANVQL